jgi:hypothetical protein
MIGQYIVLTLIQHPSHLPTLSVMLNIILVTILLPVWVLLSDSQEYLSPNIRVGLFIS